MIVTVAAAILSIAGIASTGLYPAMIVLLLWPLVPVMSKVYAKKNTGSSNNFQINYYTTLTVINLLLILVMLWIAFVIVHDRVLNDCC